MSRSNFFLALVSVSFLYMSSWAEPTTEPAQSPDPDPQMPKAGFIPENIAAISTGEFSPKHVFVADKSSRTLTLWVQENDKPKLVGAYPMDIGKNAGDKTNEGDHKTPEGIYFFQERKEGPGLDFSLYGKRAFTLDYPNYFDIRAGKTGSGIWLHAVPDSVSLNRGSRGCVVVRNSIVEKLTAFINLKITPLLILDKVNYISESQVSDRRKELSDWVEKWRLAWETKNLDQYMSHYHKDFKSLQMNRTQWQKYKDGLNKKYKKIAVQVKSPLMLLKKNEAIIRFVQHYQSDAINDVGEKTLYVQKNDKGQFEILSEVWRPVARDVLANF